VDLDVPDGPVPLQISDLSDPLDQDRTGKIKRGGAHLGFTVDHRRRGLRTGIELRRGSGLPWDTKRT
jgi:hypothetical protein